MYLMFHMYHIFMPLTEWFKGGGLVGVSQNVDNNNFGHSVYIYNSPILHHLQWIFRKSTISPLKGTILQVTIYNYFASLVYILQPEFGTNNNLQNNQTPPSI